MTTTRSATPSLCAACPRLRPARHRRGLSGRNAARTVTHRRFTPFGQARGTQPTTTTVAVLRRHRHEQEAELAALGVDGGGYVFTNIAGQPISPDRLSINFGKLIAAIGLPPVRLHDLRCDHVISS
jgi:hypothetical protein